MGLEFKKSVEGSYEGQKPNDGLVGKVYGIEINHQYNVLGGLFEKDPPKRHACLENGWWCWLNAREHPRDVIKYLKKKIRRMKR